MRNTLVKRCSLLVENRDQIRSAFAWESTYIYPLCANLYAARWMQVDTERLKICWDILKTKTGVFSNFRGTARMAVITQLSLASNPEGQLDRMIAVYNRLKELFWGSEYLAVTAASIVQFAEPYQDQQIIMRTRAIYEQMKKAHPFITSGEDSTFAALLALTEFNEVQIGEEIERCYALLKPEFFSGNAVQALSQVLALGNQPAEQKCARTMELFHYLKNKGYKYGTNYELATLGVFAMMDQDIKVIAQDIMDADNYLKQCKGFGAFGIGAKQRLMYAAMLTMCDYLPDMGTVQATALSGVVSLVVAQQAAICASVAVASAAATSSSSN